MKDNTHLLYDLSKQTLNKNIQFKIYHHNSYYKTIRKIKRFKTFLNEINEHINTHYKSKYVLIQIKDYYNIKNEEIIKKSEKINNMKKSYYSNEYIKFENQITKIPHFFKKYKEDEISFAKNQILPEIKWQDYDNDVLTSEEQKKSAIKKAINSL